MYSIYAASKTGESQLPQATALPTTDPSSLATSGNQSSPMGVSTGQTSLFSDTSGGQRGYKVAPSTQSTQSVVQTTSVSAVLEGLPTKALSPILETSTTARPCECLGVA